MWLQHLLFLIRFQIKTALRVITSSAILPSLKKSKNNYNIKALHFGAGLLLYQINLEILYLMPKNNYIIAKFKDFLLKLYKKSTIYSYR